MLANLSFRITEKKFPFITEKHDILFIYLLKSCAKTFIAQGDADDVMRMAGFGD